MHSVHLMEAVRKFSQSLKLEHCKKTCVGDGDKLEHALDDVYGTGVMVRSCYEKRLEKNICKSTKILQLSQKYLKTNSVKL